MHHSGGSTEVKVVNHLIELKIPAVLRCQRINMLQRKADWKD